MSLADTIANIRSGLFQIAFVNSENQKIAGGTVFQSHGFLITNNHVFAGHLKASRVGIRRDDMPHNQYRVFDPPDFRRRLIAGSDRNSYDYAILRMPEIIQNGDHNFLLQAPNTCRIGDPIALLGFPLDHDNLSCHQGVISSFYQSGLAHVIQLDASVNAGNSGGPLIDPQTGAAIGIVTRKATGLSGLFEQLRNSIQANLTMAQGVGGGINIGGLDIVEAFTVSQNQMVATLDEIERQANVGIGYAFSAEHVLAEECMQ